MLNGITKLSLLIGAFFAPTFGFATSAIQFDASRSQSIIISNGSVNAWNAYRRSESMVPCHSNNCAWAAPSYAGAAFYFSSEQNCTAPFAFDSSATSIVSRVFVVADSSVAMPLTTLVDVPCPLRVAPFFDSSDSHTFSTVNVLGTTSLLIDNAESDLYSTGLHLYELTLSTPCQLNEIYVGGNPATPAWRRSWNGSVHEVVFVAGTPSPVETNAIQDYLSKKWGLPGPVSRGRDHYSIICDLGLRPGKMYSSTIIFR